MKYNNYEYSASGEITVIVCDLHGVDLRIVPSHENELQIVGDNGKRLNVSLDGSTLKIVQGNLNSLFLHKKKRIEVRVPEHTVPEIAIDGKHTSIAVTGGIYGKFSVDGDDCTLKCESASFSECSFTGSALSTYLKDVTVKNTLVVNCDEGDTVWENSFAACTECRIKRGNIGLSGFNCKDSILAAENGNVAARLSGEQSDYNLAIFAKAGTANRESVMREGAARSFKAYSAKGNIAVDFVPGDEETVYN